MIEIKNREGSVIHTIDADTLISINLEDAKLSGANLSGADLRHADLTKADLTKADLRGADLSGADLRGADLRDADVRGADVHWVKLDNALIDWMSHDIIAEILRQAASDDADKRMIAGLIWMSRDWCWSNFFALAHPLQDWAMKVLGPWNTETNPMPESGVK